MRQPDRVLAPLLADDSVIVAYGDFEAKQMASLDAKTGRIRWKTGLAQGYFVGELRTCGTLVYANVSAGGACVLRLLDGAVKTRLKDAYVWDCNPRFVFASSWSQKPHQPAEETLGALDAQTLRPVWRKLLAPWRVAELVSHGDKLELVLAKGWTETGGMTRQAMTVRAADGMTISRSVPQKWVSNRTAEDVIRGTLPRPVRDRLTRLLARKGGVFIGCTRVLRLGDLFFAGNFEDSTAPSHVYAIRGGTGQIVWKRSAPGLYDIALADSRLFVAYGSPPKYEMRGKVSLMALNAQTGDRLWRVDLPVEPEGD
jgi:outer membrane protein assembly factor BamB